MHLIELVPTSRVQRKGHIAMRAMSKHMLHQERSLSLSPGVGRNSTRKWCGCIYAAPRRGLAAPSAAPARGLQRRWRGGGVRAQVAEAATRHPRPDDGRLRDSRRAGFTAPRSLGERTLAPRYAQIRSHNDIDNVMVGRRRQPTVQCRRAAAPAPSRACAGRLVTWNLRL